MPGRPDWTKSKSGDMFLLEARAKELHRDGMLNGWQVFCGSRQGDEGHAIYAIKGISPIAVASEFETGVAFGDTPQLCAELVLVDQIARFRPYFVDPSGYKCRFLEDLTPDKARDIEATLTVGMEHYLDEGGSTMAAMLLRENELRLWWD